jgi:hypothetical protein
MIDYKNANTRRCILVYVVICTRGLSKSIHDRRSSVAFRVREMPSTKITSTFFLSSSLNAENRPRAMLSTLLPNAISQNWIGLSAESSVTDVLYAVGVVYVGVDSRRLRRAGVVPLTGESVRLGCERLSLTASHDLRSWCCVLVSIYYLSHLQTEAPFPCLCPYNSNSPVSTQIPLQNVY